mmetsp:Transcript_29072/g.57072  ORF Transcript_29072/g.57072 Transcript_29072/m.57072 type:complete len:86 (+) Transcript_29072:67-324(+)
MWKLASLFLLVVLNGAAPTAPTSAPTTSAPTTSPTTSAPTTSPTTSAPTTSAPTTSAPTTVDQSCTPGNYYNPSSGSCLQCPIGS